MRQLGKKRRPHRQVKARSAQRIEASRWTQHNLQSADPVQSSLIEDLQAIIAGIGSEHNFENGREIQQFGGFSVDLFAHEK